MRKLALRDMLAERSASFQERCGVEIANSFSDAKNEYCLIRDAVGITDFSFMQKFRVPAESGLDFLDSLFAGNVAKIRFYRVLHTFLANEQGHVIADVYVANNDEDFIVLCESIVDDATLKNIFDAKGAKDAGLQDMSDTHIVIGIDGYRAWEVVKDLFGADVLGLPYLSIEMYPFEETSVSLFRAGKTSEFGYLVMAPKEIGPKLLEKLLETAKKYNGGLCGSNIHNDLRLEGRFFNIFAEGMRVKDPLSLGLQWMIDFDKEAFIGRDTLLERREKGIEKKIIGIKADASVKDLQRGTKIVSDGETVAQVQATCFSYALNANIGLALFPFEIAYAGLQFKIDSAQAANVQTISMPPIIPKSLSVKLNEM
ncbi:glycine cleavage T C-terminal barrel domain-containing protein [Candidatus Omnitrophota bacterium]